MRCDLMCFCLLYRILFEQQPVFDSWVVRCEINVSVCVCRLSVYWSAKFVLWSCFTTNTTYNPNQTHKTQTPIRRFTTLPYIQGTSEQIQRVLFEAGIKTAFKPIWTISQMLLKLKDKVKDNKKLGLVYQIPCKNCEFSYIGETKRSFPTRLGEHKADVQKMNTMTNALAYHAWKKDHNIDYYNTV